MNPAKALAQEPLQTEVQEEGTVELTRGPIHEAFATTVSFDPEPGVIVDRAPPDLIEEIPPDQRPAGDKVSWIPGYWGWDEDEADFIWISGIWRHLPPDRQWIPGYWADIGTEWQWIFGYWASEEQEEVVYLPKPPQSVETGPNVRAPSENHIWVSGTWIHRQERYAWRPGYWLPARPDWSWTPAHYQYARGGYVFIDGYWDYEVARRGVVFAPVRFHRNVYTRPNYYYRPTTVININVFVNHLWVRPRYGHYYFGDYYAPRYHDRGFYASFSYHTRRGYDPIYAHTRWENRDVRDWERIRRDRFDYYRTHEEARPPHTWAAMRERDPEFRDRRDELVFAEPLDSYVRQPDRRQRFEPVTDEYRERVVEQGQEVRRVARERQQIERRVGELPEEERREARRERVPKSPLVGQSAERLTGDDAPPERPREAPEETPAERIEDREEPTMDQGPDGVRPSERPEGETPDRSAGESAAETDRQAERTERPDREQRKPVETAEAPRLATPERRPRPEATTPAPRRTSPERQAGRERAVKPEPARERAPARRAAEQAPSRVPPATPSGEPKPKTHRSDLRPQTREATPQARPEREPRANPEPRRQRKQRGEEEEP